MYLGTEASFQKAVSLRDHEADALPPEVRRLYPREREIAAIVYLRGLATAADIETGLSSPLSNAAVRSMLNRLVAKGILTRLKCGPHRTFVYGPALTSAAARETALRQFAQDFYAGSLASLAEAIADMFARDMLPQAAASRGNELSRRSATH